MAQQIKEPDWIVTTVSLADSSVIPLLLRIEYGRGNGKQSHLSIIISDKGEESRVPLTIDRQAGSIHSKTSIEIARGVSETMARNFVADVDKLLEPQELKTKETIHKTRHGEILVFSVVSTNDDAFVFGQIDTKTALTPVVPED